MMSADLLVLLSDVDGLYDKPPEQNGATLVPVVARITPEIEAMAGASESEHARGGMLTKIEAGKIATTAGTHMMIASGHVAHPLEANRGRRGLHLVPDAGQSGDRAQEVDRRFARAARRADDRRRRGQGVALGKSLLPAGVVKIEGAFGRGDAVVVRGPDGHEIGRGLIAYDAEDAERIKGHSSGDILSILGFGGRTR